MNRRPLRIIGINPGTRYLGIAVLDGSELLDWRIRALAGKWSKKKLEKVSEILFEIFDQYEPTVLSIKKLHFARRTINLLKLANKIKELARRKGLKVREYSIKDINTFFIEGEKLNKQNLIKAMAKKYPELQNDLKNELCHKNHYLVRMFEAVALGSVYSLMLP
jgi:Holliday junction resolvasome RuvABC endonuclease subunit